MKQKDRKQTKATKVFNNLRDDIISGCFSPGEKLQMELLKERYGIGYSPLREALSRLVMSGLVQSEEQCGFCVAPLSLEELYDLYAIRSHIEILALELSIQHGDDQWESEVVACWHRYEKFLNPKTNKKHDPVEWDALQKEFGTLLIKACRSPWLLKIREQLYDHASRYRFICMKSHHENKKLLLEFLQENENLVSAVLARDKAKAVKISKVGWDNTIKVISKNLQAKLASEKKNNAG